MSDDDPSAPDAPDAVTADETGAVTADPTDPDPLPGEPPAPLRPTDLVVTRGARRVRIALAVLLVLAAGLLVGRLTAGGDDAAETDEDTQATAGEELPFPSGDQNRTDYWAYAGLDPTVIDTFDRPDSPNDLGVTGTGQPWESVSGTWGVGDDRALSGGGSGDEPLLAVVPEGTGDGLTEVTMTAVEEGAGLVFRYQDPENYWSVTANPGVGSWSVNRVIDGDAELAAEASGPTNDGITVSVTQDDSVVRLLLDGVEYLNLTDAALGDQLQGGITVASTSSGQARWDRFLVMRFRETDGATTTTAAP